MKRTLVFAYNLINYLVFVGVSLYLAAFLSNQLVPRSIDSAPVGPLWQALLVNLLLLAAFAVQHSVMARPSFKQWWTRMAPAPAERSTYVMFSNLALILLFWQWQPMGGVVWDVRAPMGRGINYGVFAFGWFNVLLATFMINHFDLFGLRQAWLYLRGKAYTTLAFKTPGPYRLVRHPLYAGWLMVFWAAPTMTVGRLAFAVAMTVYILVAIWFEERNLVEYHGQAYADYRRKTPMLIPSLFGRDRNGITPEGAPAATAEAGS
jgi:protein-S-isoprenylcysteine O-methyltransferase Ste14